MKLSIIIPFNSGIKMLKDCLDSLSIQNYKGYEVILVKDHGCENVEELVKEYPSLDIKVISNTNNEGVAGARNTGLAAAEGEYVYFLDADDYLYEGALESLMNNLNGDGRESTSPIDVVYSKKVWTWYSRAGFLSTFNINEEGLSDDDTKGEDSGEDDSASTDNTEDLTEIKRREYVDSLSPEEYEQYEIGRAGKRLLSNRKGIRNVSVLGILFRKELIDTNEISFNENFRYYSDLSFVCEVLEKAHSIRKNYDSLYIKRKHGDPINFPSLAQEKSDYRFDELVDAYEYARSLLDSESSVRFRLEVKFINYYTRYFVTRVRRDKEHDYWRGERFERMGKVLASIPSTTLKRVKLYKRRLVKAAIAGNIDKTYRIISFRLGIKKAFNLIRHPSRIPTALYLHVFMKMPVRKDYVMFECFFGKSYGDNPKGIYEYLAANYSDKYKFIWSINSKSQIPFKATKVKRFGIRYAYYIARSKYFVFNTKQPGWMRKRDEQVFLETWHGTPLKRLAFDMEDNFSASPGYKQQIYKQTRSWDYLVSANAFSSECFRSCFMFDGSMLEFGYPRNDILHRENRDEIAAQIKKKLGIPADKKTILYAPTWRDDEFYAAGQYKFTLKLDLPKMKEALSDEYVVLLRTHYYIADKLDVTGMEGFAYNLSKYDDIAEIYLISDICITDYSSVFFDYANLRRPLLFYTYDIEKYRGMLRGFYIDMEATVPGPLLYTTEEVIDSIKNIDEINDRFKDRYDEFYERFCGWEDGHASQNIVNKVFFEDNE